MIKQMLKKNPSDDFLVYAAALEYHKEGNSAKSIELLESLISRNPKYLGAYYQLGKLLEETGRDENAIEVYRNGLPIAKEQNDLKSHGEILEALMFLEDPD